MKQYRITSEHFVHQGETGDADTVMHPDDLAEIKRLAGIVSEAGPGIYTGAGMTNTESGTQSPVGSNISFTAAERRQMEYEYCARPGDELWFVINFTKPFLNGSLKDHVEQWLAEHPDYKCQRR